jgi:uncharacterized protein
MPPPENDNRRAEERAAAACPICAKPRVEKFRPFCSPRCADVDLQRWLSGRYVIPAAEGESGAEEEIAAER